MSEQKEEQSSKFFIFGNREIFPLGFTKGKTATEKKFVGTFMMVNGQTSYPARYKEEKRTWIPFDVSNPESKINNSPTYQEILIMFAEIYYGAKWNSETNELEQTEETALYRKTNLLDFSQYLGSFKNMEYMHHLISQGTTPRIKRDKEGLLAKSGGVEGFGKDMYQRYKRVVEAYNEPNADNIAKGVKPIVGKKLTAQEQDRLRSKKREFTAKPAEMEQKWRENFYNQPYIEKWVEVMQDNLIETWNSTRSGIARVFLINNLLNPIEFKKLTIGLATEPDEKRIKRLKEIVAIWKRWNSRYDTPQSFYEEKWIDQKYDKKEELEFPDGIYDALKDFPERDHKGGLERKFDAKQSEETARKAAADYLVAFITNAPEGSWSISDVKVGTMLSRKTATPAFAEHGSKIDDKQVREALKFLETGKIHVWQPKLKDGKKVFREVEKFNPHIQQMETEYEEVFELVPDPDDNNPHYNEQLKEYQMYGKPYSPTSPAAMLFRISILCGWRKTEALTATTRLVSKSTLIKRADFESNEKPSGLEIDRETGLLKISFVTRKTKKRGAEGAFFTVVIPPFSSSVMDTRDTIEMVCKKAGIGKWSNRNFYDYEIKEGKVIEVENKKWIPKIIPLEQKELDELFPELNVKQHGKVITRSKGVKSGWLIGDDGQFYRPYGINKEGNSVPSYDMPDGSGKYGLARLEEAEMIDAYLNFPLRECYAVMSGTTVRHLSDKEVMDQVTADHKFLKETKPNINHKTFTMIKGWSQVCSLGCPEIDKTKKATGKYSKERMSQDSEKYMTDDQDYWIDRSIHSLRHIFAQLWLRKSKWNFGVVADRGHWETLDTLKKHYGGVPDETLGGFMTEVLASDQVGEKAMNQAVNRSIALRNEEGGYSKEMADTIKEQEVKEEEVEEKEKEEIQDV